jgi:hypothetical protein
MLSESNVGGREVLGKDVVRPGPMGSAFVVILPPVNHFTDAE